MKNILQNHIPVIQAPVTRAEVDRYLAESAGPVVIQGLVQAWPAWQKWSFDWFKKTHGDTVIPVEWLKYVKGDGVARRAGQVKDMTIAEFVDRLPSCGYGESGYLIGQDLFRKLPNLRDDIQFPRYHDLERLVEKAMFIGGTGTYTQLHYDRAQNLHAMLQGQKRWQMYSPKKSRELRPLRYEFPWSVGSEYDVVIGSDFSQEKIAAPENLPGGLTPDYDFCIDAGDVLVVPYGWWHRVLTTESAIATNYWWWSYSTLLQYVPGLVPELLKDQVRKVFKKKAVRRGYYDE
jgi:Cupin-like domain